MPGVEQEMREGKHCKRLSVPTLKVYELDQWKKYRQCIFYR